MALSRELQEVYSSNTLDIRAYDTIELSHSLFSQTFYLIQDDVSHTLKLESGESVEFVPFGFNVVLPTKGSNQQDVGLVFDNVAQIGIKELELAAENIKENIVCKYRAYIDGDDTPQSYLELALTNVSADPFKITSNASRVSLYDRHVPKRRYDSWVFLGVA